MSVFGTLPYIISHPLSRGRAIANVARFALWQSRSRLGFGATDFAWVAPTRLHVAPGMTSATGHLYVGLQEFEDMAFVMHFLQPGDLFADVGANVGAYTVLAAGVAGADVVACEPGVEARGWLHQNITLNRLGAYVSIRSEAVGDHLGAVAFSTGRDTTNAVLTSSEVMDGSVMACLSTLDEICSHRTPALIKIDVEGFEMPVLRGARAILADSDLLALIIELNGAGAAYGFSDEAICLELVREGFHMVTYDPWRRMLNVLHSLDARRVGQDNVIFVRDKLRVSDRVAGAPPFRVRGWTI